eukprot:RCo047417
MTARTVVFLFLLFGTVLSLDPQVFYGDIVPTVVVSGKPARALLVAVTSTATSIDIGLPILWLDLNARPALAWSHDDSSGFSTCSLPQSGYLICPSVPLPGSSVVNIYLNFVLTPVVFGNAILNTTLALLVKVSGTAVTLTVPGIPLSVAPVPDLVAVAGCVDYFPVTTNCPASGQTPLYLFGYGFGPSNGAVYVGSQRAASVVHVPLPNATDQYYLIARGYAQANPPNNLWQELPVVVTSYWGVNTTAGYFVSINLGPQVLGVSGCNIPTLAAKQVSSCSPDGLTPITVYGANFGPLRAASIRLLFGANSSGGGGFPCLQYSQPDTSTLVCTSYRVQGQNLPVRVVVNGEVSPQSDVRVSFAAGTAVSRVQGCQPNPSNWRATALCPSGGSTAITIVGVHLNQVTSVSAASSQGSCSSLIPDPQTPDNVLVCSGLTGTPGAQLSLRLALATGEVVVPPNVTVGFAVGCSTGCGTYGTCDLWSGSCSCDSSFATGFWQGPTCSECQPGYWGATCLRQCPSTLCGICNQHGECSDGVNGNGQCTCSQSSAAGFW